MAKRGRRSGAEMAVASYLPLSRAAAAPDAPYDLSDEAAAVWRGVVDSLPAEYFPPEAFDTLAAYCRHVVSARFLAREIDRFTPEWLQVEGGVDRLNKLLAMRDRETRGMLSAARSLRLTNQSRYRPEKALDAAGKRGSRPWD